MDASELFSPSVVAVLHSIQKGDAAGARYSLSHGADLNVQGKAGVTPLQWLIYQTQDKPAVQRAQTLGDDPNFKDGAGDSAVNTLAGGKDPEWLRLILDAGGITRRPSAGVDNPRCLLPSVKIAGQCATAGGARC